jgi:O-antigen ligase
MKSVRFKHIALCLFVFLFPFDGVTAVPGGFSLTKIGGLFYIFSIVLDHEQFSKIRPLWKFFIPLYVLYCYLFFISYLYSYYEPISRVSAFNYELTQSIIIFSLVAIDLLENRRLQSWVLLSFALSITLMSILISQGIQVKLVFGRLSIFGYNPNTIGTWGVYSIVCVLCILMYDKEVFGVKRYLLLLLIPSFLSMMVASGSRGAIIIVLVLFVIFALLGGRSLKAKIYITMLILALGGLMYVYIMDSAMMQKRIELGEEDKLGGRVDIWSASINRYWDHPILGVGETGYITANRDYRLMYKSDVVLDTHNLFLYILICGGAIGFIAFTYFLFNILRCSWTYFKQTHNIGPFVFFCMIVLYMSKSGGILADKTMWLFLSYIIGVSASTFKMNIKKHDLKLQRINSRETKLNKNQISEVRSKNLTNRGISKTLN